MKKRHFLLMVFCAALGGFVAMFTYSKLQPKSVNLYNGYAQPASLASYSPNLQGTNIDFTFAAENTIHAVVHVKVTSRQQSQYSQNNPLYDFFFGYRDVEPRQVEGYGSGVIISSDGYIITNNHVIKNADQIEVTLNDNRSMPAKLVGTDPSTDIAVIKVSGKDLPIIPYGDSDALKVGEWVLAVGNPYNLTSTVTAGIVSAKSRKLGIIRTDDEQDDYEYYGNTPYGRNEGQRTQQRASLGIESFIQTDAAVNPGNSGGALVNIRGELVGINTAIQSRTGSYSGNSFAVPTTIVKKVVSDIIEFGSVQRAYLGILMNDVTASLAEEYDLKDVQGVYVVEVVEKSAAEKAGIKTGDVIVSVGGVKTNNSSQIQEQVSKYRPGDEISVEYVRNKQSHTINVKLQGQLDDNSATVKPVNDLQKKVGATFEEVPEQIKNRLEIKNGIRVKSLTSNGYLRRSGVPSGFIIVKVDKQSVSSEKDFYNILENAKGYVLIEGYQSNGYPAAFALQVD